MIGNSEGKPSQYFHQKNSPQATEEPFGGLFEHMSMRGKGMKRGMRISTIPVMSAKAADEFVELPYSPECGQTTKRKVTRTKSHILSSSSSPVATAVASALVKPTKKLVRAQTTVSPSVIKPLEPMSSSEAVKKVENARESIKPPDKQKANVPVGKILPEVKRVAPLGPIGPPQPGYNSSNNMNMMYGGCNTMPYSNPSPLQHLFMNSNSVPHSWDPHTLIPPNSAASYQSMMNSNDWAVNNFKHQQQMQYQEQLQQQQQQQVFSPSQHQMGQGSHISNQSFFSAPLNRGSSVWSNSPLEPQLPHPNLSANDQQIRDIWSNNPSVTQVLGFDPFKSDTWSNSTNTAETLGGGWPTNFPSDSPSKSEKNY